MRRIIHRHDELPNGIIRNIRHTVNIESFHRASTYVSVIISPNQNPETVKKKMIRTRMRSKRVIVEEWEW